MSEDVRPEKIRKTQESLSKYIKKPPLTEKLLKKPPFRFLHDIVTSVMKETGFLEGVFSPEELSSENIKDREGKISFLEKLISHIKSATGSSISAKPSKIVAGLEVNKTLDLLIVLSQALEIKKSGEKQGLVDKKKEAKPLDNKTKQKEPKNAEKKSSDKNSDEKKRSTRGKEEKEVELNRRKSKGDTKESQKEKVSEKSGSSKSKGEANRNGKLAPKVEGAKKVSKVETSESVKATANGEEGDKKPGSRQPSAQADQALGSTPLPTTETTHPEIPAQLVNGDVTPPNAGSFESGKDEDRKEESKEEARVASGKINGEAESNEEKENEKEPKTEPKEEERITSGTSEEREKSSAKLKRPQSARKRPSSKQRRGLEEKTNSAERSSFDSSPPVMGRNSVDGADSGIMASSPVSIPSAKGGRPMTGRRPLSARPGAPRPKDRGLVNIPEPSTSEDAKPVALIEDKKDVEEEDIENLVVVEKQIVKTDFDQDMDSGIELQADDGNQGALVSQILETNKEFEENKKNQWSAFQKPTVEIEWDKRNKARREAWGREVDRLREGIQGVTRASNPLGKLFDFLQEDVELMHRELESWHSLTKQLQADLATQNRITEESLGQLKKQLQDMDVLIENEQEAIRRVKANIFLNNSKIDNLLKVNSP